MAKFLTIGLMSGTSLDGLDICACDYILENETWRYHFLVGETIPYSDEIKDKLSSAPGMPALEFSFLNSEFGRFLGEQVNLFIKKHKLNPQLVSSHGHTVFHQPEKKLTVQIGSGAELSAITRLPVVCDFRSVDVALNGQGAPLVPAGEKYLFPEYPYLVNLGGFANITIQQKNEIRAFDICPANIVLNSLAKLLQPSSNYDKDGENARKGKVINHLLESLNSIGFYQLPPPKSLGKEWVEMNIDPILEHQGPVGDILRTFTEHIAIQVSSVLNNKPEGKVLVTGGGAFNSFLIERISHFSKHKIIVPDKATINFKEAIIFGFLGVLRVMKIPNAFKSVTGADFDNIGGAVFQSIP